MSTRGIQAAGGERLAAPAGRRSRLGGALLGTTALAGVSVALLTALTSASAQQYFDDNQTVQNGAIDGGNGPWDTTTTNWTNAAGTANAAYDSAPATVTVFGAGSSTPATGGTVTVDGGGIQLTNTVQFRATGNGSIYTITGGPLTTAVAGTTFDVANVTGTAAADAVIESNIGGSSLAKTGPGTLVLTGTNTYTGATTISTGTLIAGSDGALPNTTHVTVTAGGTLEIADGVFADINALSGSGSVAIGTANASTVLSIGFAGGATTTFSGSFSGPGSLEIAGGSQTLTGASTIGGILGICDCATLTLTGPTASFTNTGAAVFVGGTFNVENGAALATDSVEIEGTMAVTGPNTTVTAELETVVGSGFSLDARLTVTGGASFTTGDLVTNGDGSRLTITGPNTTVTANGVTIVGGPFGGTAPTATIGGGGTLNSRFGAVIEGDSNLPRVTVTDAGSTWNVDSGLAVGGVFFGGVGSLTVQNGGVVNVANGTLIAGDPSFGLGPSTLLVTGAGSQLNTDALQIGQVSCICGDLAGTLTVADGGRVTATTGVTIAPLGVLNLGNGALAGSIDTPAIVNDGQIVANFTDTLIVGATISGAGTLTKQGAGTLTLTADNLYTGATVVNGGGLIVNGSIATSSSLTVSGGFVGGSGVLPSTTIGDGAALSPGNSIGIITIGGNLTFAGAGNYIVEVSPTDADRTNVTGTATLAGTVQAVLLPGSYVARTYTILHADGGRLGTFDAITTTGLPGFTASLSYTATDVILGLTAALGQGVPLGGNPGNVAAAINNAFNNGAALPPDFLALFGPGGTQALAQITGEIGTGAATAGFRTMDQFLQLMLDPFLENRAGGASQGGAGGPALAFTPESEAELALGFAKGMPRKAPALPTFEQRWTVWGAGYGGHGSFDGDATVASNDLSVNAAGVAGGVDYRFGNSVVGAAVTGQSLSYRLAAGLGSGSGDAIQGGLYGSTKWDNWYLSAALSFGWYDLDTTRIVLLPGVTNVLSGDVSANSIGGRIEGGYRVPVLRSSGVTPYAALQALSFRTDAYSEIGAPGASAFALSYAANSTHDVRSELGLRFDTRMLVDDTSMLILRARAAWAHAFDTDRSINAFFVALPGAGFTVFGATPAEDSALLSAGGEWRLASGFALLAKIDGEFSGDTTAYAGSGTLRYSW